MTTKNIVFKEFLNNFKVFCIICIIVIYLQKCFEKIFDNEI